MDPWQWCEEIVAELIAQGIETFCIAPGSRSTPLAMAVANHPRAKAFVHFDERSLAFFAFGYAKAANKPVALIVTSGSAVANLFPALLAASEEQIPLVVLTADRPPELLHCGANQTTDQCKIFGTFVRSFIELPCPGPGFELSYLRRTVAYGVSLAQRSPAGPVHLNCLLREERRLAEGVVCSKDPFTIYERGNLTSPPSTLHAWAEALSSIERGVVVLGALPANIDLAPLFQLAEQLGWPLFADVGARSYGPHTHLILGAEMLLKEASSAEAILHIGGRLVSKSLQSWIAHSKPTFYGMVADHPQRIDPTHQVTRRLEAPPEHFCRELAALLPSPTSPPAPWLLEWQEKSGRCKTALADVFAKLPLTEPLLPYTLSELTLSPFALFFANSMPIRDADAFFFPKTAIGPIFSSRGLSGIDGNIATAAGLAQGSKRPLIALIGDLAALHDLGALAQLSELSYPVILVLINNGGGGIFSFLPIKEQEPHFERFFAAAHGWDFAAAAKMFDLPYTAPHTRLEWEGALAAALKGGQSSLIEVKTNRQENVTWHTRINTTCQNKRAEGAVDFAEDLSLERDGNLNKLSRVKTTARK